nr:hypothetical protein K-LCC10_0400 [Kaumoebavirus]
MIAAIKSLAFGDYLSIEECRKSLWFELMQDLPHCNAQDYFENINTLMQLISSEIDESSPLNQELLPFVAYSSVPANSPLIIELKYNVCISRKISEVMILLYNTVLNNEIRPAESVRKVFEDFIIDSVIYQRDEPKSFFTYPIRRDISIADDM